MSDIAIKVENLGKSYTIGHNTHEDERYTALRDVIARNAKNFVRTTRDMFQGKSIIQGDEVEEFWALKDVSFDIKQGDRVGIIGRNGAGKSTLLKILSRITEPTKGRVQINGRVASLLEVGTGFHPELTGRENIFLNGAILGMSRREIQRKFDEIVDFAQIEMFLDTPVKRYSSGMYVRLAFAVAAHLEPEILIVDEVLAVGDLQFQKKCLGKMHDVAKEGRTIIFVSHNMTAIEQLTQNALILKEGVLSTYGPTDQVVSNYLDHQFDENIVIFDVEKISRKLNWSQEVQLLQFRFNKKFPSFNLSEDIQFITKIKSNINVKDVRISMTIFAVDGTAVGSCFSYPILDMKKGDEADILIQIPNLGLAQGSYYFGVAVGRGDNITGYVDYDVVLETLTFEVLPSVSDQGTLSSWTKGWGYMSLAKPNHKILCLNGYSIE